ncbi:MAG: hypothetical protein ABFD50_19025 [Smithella sp.]
MEAIENTAINVNNENFGLFVPADVLKSFNADFLDEDRCRVWIMWLLHRDITQCPKCGEEIPQHLWRSFWICNRIRCSHCHTYFTALTGTFLSGCHMKFREIILLSFMLSLGASDKAIAETLKISAENVRLWRLKFKELEINVKSGK